MFGNVKKFSVESEVKEFYSAESLMALGFFNIHINGIRYGVHERDASMLSCSYNEVKKRVSNRGRHVSPFGNDFNAADLVESYQKSNYGIGRLRGPFVGMKEAHIVDLILKNNLLWAPDGDEAFDDGGHIFHFDLNDSVRLIGFKNKPIADSISDLTLGSDYFYATLSDWAISFLEDWEKNR